MPDTDIQPTGQPFDADRIDVALAEVTENVDHAEAQYNPWALQALRAAEALRAELDRLRGGINEVIANYERTADEYGSSDEDFAEDCLIVATKLRRVLDGAR